MARKRTISVIRNEPPKGEYDEQSLYPTTCTLLVDGSKGCLVAIRDLPNAFSHFMPSDLGGELLKALAAILSSHYTEEPVHAVGVILTGIPANLAAWLENAMPLDQEEGHRIAALWSIAASPARNGNVGG